MDRIHYCESDVSLTSLDLITSYLCRSFMIRYHESLRIRVFRMEIQRSAQVRVLYMFQRANSFSHHNRGPRM